MRIRQRRGILAMEELTPPKTVQVDLALEGLFDFFTAAFKRTSQSNAPKEDAGPPKQLVHTAEQALAKTYGSLAWVESNLREHQHVSPQLAKKLTYRGKTFATPLQALEQGMLIEKQYLAKYKAAYLDYARKTHDVEHYLVDNLTTRNKDVANMTKEQVYAVLQEAVKRLKALKLPFPKTFIGPEWFDGCKPTYNDVNVSMEEMSVGGLPPITAQDVVAAARKIEDYWKGSPTEELVYGEDEPAVIDYHLYKWVDAHVGQTPVAETLTLEIYSHLGEEGEVDRQQALLRLYETKMHDLIKDVGNWLYQVTTKV